MIRYLALLAVLFAVAAAPLPARAQRIFGQVLRPDGSPAAAARVQLVRPRAQAVPFELGRHLPDTQEDEVTSFACDGEGNFRAPARRGEVHGLLALEGELISEFVTPVCAGDPVVLRLLPARVLAGTVLLAEEGRELVTADGSRVRVRIRGEAPGAAVRAPSARFETRAGPGGAWWVRVPERAHCVVEVLAEQRLGSGILARAEEPDARVLQVVVRSPVRGRLVDGPTGKPVAGAQVRWVWENGNGPSAWSDQEGRFTLPRLSGRNTIHVLPSEHLHAFVALSDRQASGADEVEVQLVQSAVRVTGRLLRAGGKPLGGARVLFSADLYERFAANVSENTTGWLRVLPEDGRIDLACLHPGQPVSGFVEVDGTFVRFLTGAPAQDLELGDVRLSARGKVEGTVVGPDGSPIAGAVVVTQPALDELGPDLALQLCSDPRVTVADRVGRFLVDGLEPADCTLFALAPGFGPVRVETKAGHAKALPLRIELGTGSEISGRVVDEDGRAVAGAWIRLLVRAGDDPALAKASWAVPPLRTDANGRFLLRGLLATEVDVEASLTLHGKFVRRSVRLPPGEDAVTRSGELVFQYPRADVELVLK